MEQAVSLVSHDILYPDYYFPFIVWGGQGAIPRPWCTPIDQIW